MKSIIKFCFQLQIKLFILIQKQIKKEYFRRQLILKCSHFFSQCKIFIQQNMIPNKTILEQGKISSLCFSPNFQYCAVALKSNNNILIFQVPQNSPWDINKWLLKSKLKQPTQTISSLDWSIKDKIMAGSYDRSLTIWQKKGEEYTKELANLSNKLSIIYSLWAPDGNKFAIGTSCKSVYIGSYNHEDNFWSGLLLKPKDKNPIQSTISALAFHKSGNLLAIGSTDCSLRVVTCSLANQNVMTQADKGAAYQGTYGNINTFGQVLLFVQNLEGWINNVSFATDTSQVFVLPHNNSIVTYSVPEVKDQQAVPRQTNWKNLPFLSGFYLNDNTYVAGGFDRNVTIFQRSGNGFQVAKTLQQSMIQKMNLFEKKGGLVSGMKGIWDKQAVNKVEQKLTAQQSNVQHKGAIKVLKYNNLVCSYDVNGDIHFWEV